MIWILFASIVLSSALIWFSWRMVHMWDDKPEKKAKPEPKKKK